MDGLLTPTTRPRSALRLRVPPHGLSRVVARVFARALPLWLLMSLGSSAAAQPEEYLVIIQEAVAEFEQEHWIEAQALFERANAIYPSARALWGAGMAAFERRDYATALGYLEQAVSSEERPLLPDQAENARQMIMRCRTFTARYTLEVTPASAVMSVDGLPATIIDGELVMNPGRHELTVAAPGYAMVTRTLSALPGFASAIVIGLAPVASEPDDGPTRLPQAGWATLGAGAGVGTIAFLTGSAARHMHARLQTQCGGPCPPERADDVARGRRLARTSAAFTVIGVAALGTGIGLLVFDAATGTDTTSAARARRPRVSPYFGRDGFGADLDVRF